MWVFSKSGQGNLFMKPTKTRNDADWLFFVSRTPFEHPSYTVDLGHVYQCLRSRWPTLVGLGLLLSERKGYQPFKRWSATKSARKICLLPWTIWHEYASCPVYVALDHVNLPTASVTSTLLRNHGRLISTAGPVREDSVLLFCWGDRTCGRVSVLQDVGVFGASLVQEQLGR